MKKLIAISIFSLLSTRGFAAELLLNAGDSATVAANTETTVTCTRVNQGCDIRRGDNTGLYSSHKHTIFVQGIPTTTRDNSELEVSQQELLDLSYLGRCN